MANENSNVTLTVFDRLFKDDAAVNAKNENVSAEMLKALFEYNGPETAFDKTFILTFYKMESKTRGEHIRKLFSRLSPVEFEAWVTESEIDTKSIEDKKAKTAAVEKVVEAKKKIKAAENRVRRVIEALAGIHLAKVPCKKITVKAGKVYVYTPTEEDADVTEKTEWSVAELIKAGSTLLVDEKLKVTSPRPTQGNATGNEAQLAAIVSNDKSALVKVCMNLSRTLALAEKRDTYEGEASDALQALAGEILRHFYSNDDGSALNQEAILDWLDNVEAKVFTGETVDTDEEKVA